MNIKKQIKALMTVIIEEADRNPDFAQRISSAISLDGSGKATEGTKKRHGGRRPAAILDPVALFSQGGIVLREQLEKLDLERLRDIVAEYGMDPGKLVMKWKTEQRVIDHIVETAASRAKKGEAFR